jgi:hypothetical protein
MNLSINAFLCNNVRFAIEACVSGKPAENGTGLGARNYTGILENPALKLTLAELQ